MGLLFTLVATYGGAAVALLRPYYGFLIYVSFSIIRPEALWHWSVGEGNYSRIVAIAFLLGWAISGLGTWQWGAGGTPVLFLLAFLLWAGVSTAFCEFPEFGMGFLINMSKIVLPCLVGMTLINRPRDLYLLAWTIVASLGYVAYDLNRAYFDGFNRLQEAGFGAMDNNSLTIGLVTGIGFAFFLGLSEQRLWRRYLAFAAAALMTHAVFFSFSRGGMLGLCVVGLATALLIPRTSKNLTLLGLGVVVALAMAGPQVWERFFSITENSLVGAEAAEVEWSAESRLHLWRICLWMAAENPLLGKGPDHFPLLVDRYPVLSDFKENFAHGKEAHTLWLQILAELGVPGVSFLALYYLLILWRLFPALFRDRADAAGLNEGASARMVTVALVGFFVSAQFVSLEGLELPYYVALLGAGALKLSSLGLLGSAAETSPDEMPADEAAEASTDGAVPSPSWFPS